MRNGNNVDLSICCGTIIRMASELIQKLNIEGKDSGYLTILDASDGRLILQVQIGICPADKADKYCDFSLEKAKRVFETGDQSSWQSRDPENGKWGGGIRANDHILSFSGMPELADEALSLTIAERMGWMTKQDAAAIASISGNNFLSDILYLKK